MESANQHILRITSHVTREASGHEPSESGYSATLTDPIFMWHFFRLQQTSGVESVILLWCVRGLMGERLPSQFWRCF
jgi:hypothetical protein